MTKVTIIGFGRLGSHLFYALKKSGKYSINYTVKNSKAKIDIEKINQSDIIFITTQDSKIKKAVNQLRNKDIKLDKKFIFHTSGTLTSDILKPLKSRGAYIGSFHPVQTFKSVNRYTPSFENIYIAIEGNLKAVREASQTAKYLKSKPVVFSKKDKILHHISCVISSNYLLSLIYQLDLLKQNFSFFHKYEKIRKNGFNKRIFFDIYEPLIQQTIRNIKSYGAVNSLTGPVERNDIQTIKLHLRTLKKEIPDLTPFYSYMGIETAKIALKKGSLNKKNFNSIINLFKNYIK